ncbi:hypothetical protein ANCDUO_09628, partial [Ancylostoma duodenale]
FGVTGVVYYAFLVFLCTADKTCSTFSTALDICAIVFIFTQMHFIFCNSKLFREVFQTLNNRSEQTMDEASVEAFEHRDIDLMGGCRAAECILGSLSEVMFTAIVEYSLIAAAVLYIVWRNIGRAGHGCEYVKRKHRIRVDCSKTTTGLFLGLAFLAATFTSMIVYYGYSILGKSKNAAFAYALTDISQVKRKSKSISKNLQRI